MSIWIVVADAGRARVLCAETRTSPLVEERDYVHPASRLREQNLVSDGAGSGNDSGGYGRHSMGHEKEARQREAEIFALELCGEIDREIQKGHLGSIYLLASPGFLGKLRACMKPSCASKVVAQIDKNLVNHSIEEIRSHLPRQL